MLLAEIRHLPLGASSPVHQMNGTEAKLGNGTWYSGWGNKGILHGKRREAGR